MRPLDPPCLGRRTLFGGGARTYNQGMKMILAAVVIAVTSLPGANAPAQTLSFTGFKELKAAGSGIPVPAGVLADVATLAVDSAAEAWSTDYEAALKRAKSEKKRVLVDFTGSDWCHWCILLKKEVFDTPEFKAYAAANLVLLEIDFPAKKPQSKALQDQNDALATQFKITGYPTVLMLDSAGKQLGSDMGYQAGGPAAYIAEMEKHK